MIWSESGFSYGRDLTWTEVTKQNKKHLKIPAEHGVKLSFVFPCKSTGSSTVQMRIYFVNKVPSSIKWAYYSSKYRMFTYSIWKYQSWERVSFLRHRVISVARVYRECGVNTCSFRMREGENWHTHPPSSSRTKETVDIWKLFHRTRWHA